MSLKSLHLGDFHRVLNSHDGGDRLRDMYARSSDRTQRPFYPNVSLHRLSCLNKANRKLLALHSVLIFLTKKINYNKEGRHPSPGHRWSDLLKPGSPTISSRKIRRTAYNL